jgi:hypothetical protein
MSMRPFEYNVVLADIARVRATADAFAAAHDICIAHSTAVLQDIAPAHNIDVCLLSDDVWPTGYPGVLINIIYSPELGKFAIEVINYYTCFSEESIKFDGIDAGDMSALSNDMGRVLLRSLENLEPYLAAICKSAKIADFSSPPPPPPMGG